MANVTDSASLLTIPSGWSDGVLGSLKPDDGTGDFTFSRGSDLSATRVKKNGYIERGYENLLLQSNNFNLSPWVLKPGATLTSGIADPDGGTNAWQLNFDGTANARIEQQVSVVNGSVYTFSFYGRVSSGTKIIQVGAVGQLTTKTLTTEWQRIELFGVTTGTITFPQIRTPDTSVYSIEIYQAQFNQGLVAYPYIESTTTTAKSTTILEDQPRIDYSSGTNGNILVEPQRTNSVEHSEYFYGSGYNISVSDIIETNFTTSSEGYKNASKLTTNQSGIGSNKIENARLGRTLSIFAKASEESEFLFFGPNAGQGVFFNLNDGSITGYYQGNSSNIDDAYSIPYNDDWYRFVVVFSLNTYSRFFISQNQQINFDRTAGNGIYIYGLQAEQDATSPSSYIPTYGTSTTRLKETATLTKNVASTGTIYININSDSAKTLTFLGGNVSVTQGVNKIAMAYSPIALKISHNGSIVQNITRAFDTASLTQIQLGHRNNFEQTTDGINQFLTLDSFLSDADLNELTA